MRKWIMSACVVLAWCLLPIVAAAGVRGPAHRDQANISTASSTQAAPNRAAGNATAVTAGSTVTLEAQTAATLSLTAGQMTAAPAAAWTVRPGDTLSGIAAATAVRGGWQALYAANRHAIGTDPDLIRPGTILRLPAAPAPARYTVAPGDTLAGIAAAMSVRGGWQALYAANRHAIGTDPDLIRPGTILSAPHRAVPAVPQRTAGQQPLPPPARGQAHPGGHTPAPAAGRTPAPHPAAPGSTTSSVGGMPSWLERVLLAFGLLTAAAFTAEPVLAIWRRRRRAARVARQARIITADHERLIVTYSMRDHTVYVLTPPGEDPQAVLRAARLILPEDAYQGLADHFGLPPEWSRE